MDRPYFSEAKVGDEVYGLIFGRGKIARVLPESHYTIIVAFDNGYEVPYTEDGVPGWGRFKRQTLFYKDDVDLTDVDFSPNTKVLSPKKIIKLREKNELQVRLPSGAWKSVKKADPDYVEMLLESEWFHLFRKKRSKTDKKKGA